jgi:hypothetical protein
LHVILGVVGVIVVVVAADSAGTLFRWLIFKGKQFFRDSMLDEVVSIAIGLIIISFFLFFLVSAHLVSREILWSFYLFCALLSIPRFPILLRRCIPSIKKFHLHTDGWIILLIIYFVFMILLTSLPPSVRDELIYHLEIPKRLIESKGDIIFTNNIYAYFPKLADMFFLLGLGTVGETAAKLFHVLSGFLLCVVIYRITFSWLGKKHAALTVGIFLSIPSVMVIMSWAYVDLTYVLYIVLSFLMLLEYTKQKELEHVVLAGLFMGATICIKYTGLQFVALGICFLAYAKLKERSIPLIKSILIIGIISLTLALPYFIRNWQMTGWPLFPFEVPGFQLNEGFNWDSTRAALYLRWLQTFGIPQGGGEILYTILAPVFVFVLGQFNEPQFYEGMLGPVFLLIPILLFRRKLKLEMNLLVFFSLLFIFYWAVTTKQVRFLLPVMPFLSILLSLGLQSHKKKWLTVLVCFILITNSAVGLNEIIKKGPLGYWSGRVSRAEYLGRQNRVYPVYAAANKLLRAGDKICLVHMKNYVYYLDHPWESDFVFERYRIENLLNRNPSIQGISDYFERLHITHLMLNHASIMNEMTGLEEDRQGLFARFLREKSILVFRHEAYGIYLLN